MSKRRNKKTHVSTTKQPDKPVEFNRFENGLTQALGFSGFGFGQGKQISQVDTLFENMRYYMTSNMRQLLSQAYAEIGLIQTIVDIPVDDAMRGGVSITATELDEDNIKDLENAIHANGDLLAFAQALKWNRLFGGAGIIIANNEARTTKNTILKPTGNTQDFFETPLKLSEVKQGEPLEFIPADLWELYYQYYGDSEGDEIDSHSFEPESYNYYNHKISKSRIIRFEGIAAPSFIRQRLRGWGLSVVESLVQGINQYLKATDLAFEVLDEFKVDIFKLKNLASTLAGAGGSEAIRKRVELANEQKNYQNAIVLDADDEYDSKQLSFTGIAEAMDGIRKQVASDMRIPMTKLFGTSSAGFSSGEDDIENYNGMIESSIRSKFHNSLLKMIKYRCMQVHGFVPDDLTIEFEPLRVMSSEQVQNIKTQQFNRLLQSYDTGLIDETEFREACNKDDLLGMRLEIENVGDALTEDKISDGKVEKDKTAPLALIATNTEKRK